MDINIFDPKYGKSILNRHFKNVEIRDYDKLHKKYTKRNLKPIDISGISVLAYKDPFGARIHYYSDKITFNFAIDSSDIFNIHYPHDIVTELSFEYFHYLIDKKIRNMQEWENEVSFFRRNQIPIDFDRNIKLKELIK